MSTTARLPRPSIPAINAWGGVNLTIILYRITVPKNHLVAGYAYIGLSGQVPINCPCSPSRIGNATIVLLCSLEPVP